MSTPDVTSLDLAMDTELAGGVDNSATAIIELAHSDAFDTATLAQLAGLFPASGRRMG